MAASRTLYAVVPAAGHSRRMGAPKLLLPWEGRTVLARLLDVLDRPEIAERFVVVRPGDEDLAREAGRCGATVIRPDADPPEMRSSVEIALSRIGEAKRPEPDDGWLLAPADHPLIDPRVLDALLAAWRQEACGILLPVCAGKRGHPTLFRWRLAQEVFSLPTGCGVNRLVQDRPQEVREVPVESAGILADLDTPEDYERLKEGEATDPGPAGERTRT